MTESGPAGSAPTSSGPTATPTGPSGAAPRSTGPTSTPPGSAGSAGPTPTGRTSTPAGSTAAGPAGRTPTSTGPTGGFTVAGLMGFQQPRVAATQVASASGALTRYRIMAFVTGVILISGCVALVLKYATSVDPEPYAGYLWVAHGYLYLVYVVVTALLGLKLRWPLGRFVLVMLAGTIPMMSFVAEHFVTRATRDAAKTQPVLD